MGFMAPAVPWIIKGGTMLGGALASKWGQGQAMKRSPEEAAALAGAQGAAGDLRDMSGGLYARGGEALGKSLPYMTQAGDYWSTLLGGNRGAAALATAAPRAAITDQARGAERFLQRSGVRGGAADVAKAEIGRDRFNQIAQLTAGVQPAAAMQLGQLGTQFGQLGSTLAGQGTAAAEGAGRINTNLLGQGFQNRSYARGEGQEFGKEMGGLLFDILNTKNKKGAPWWLPGAVPGGGTSGGSGVNVGTLSQLLGPALWGQR